jgi:hypothetical protein
LTRQGGDWMGCEVLPREGGIARLVWTGRGEAKACSSSFEKMGAELGLGSCEAEGN